MRSPCPPRPGTSGPRLAFGTQARIEAASARIPALTNGAAFRAEAHIVAGQPGSAFTVISDSLTARGRVDAASISGITFVPGQAEDAKVTFPGFGQDATTHRYAPTGKPKIQVEAVGSDQRLGRRLGDHAGSGPGRPGSPSRDRRSDLGRCAGGADVTESLLFEIEHRRDSGVGRYGARMHELGTRLSTAYATVSAASQRRLKARHDRAQAAVSRRPRSPPPRRPPRPP